MSATSISRAATGKASESAQALETPRFLMVAALALLVLAILIGVSALIVLRMRARRARRTGSGVRKAKQVRSVSKSSEGDRYRALFENANDLIQGIALDGKVLYANAAWQDTLDYNDREIESLTIFEVISPDSLESFKRSFERAAVGVKIKNLEITFVSKYGKKVTVEGSLHCESVDDRPAAIQAIFRDITERKRSESALKQSEERFSRVFAASPIAIAISTLDGGRIQDVNERFLTMLGHIRTEILGRTDSQLGFWANSGDRDRILKKLSEQQSVRDEQCQLRTTKGEIRQALVSAELVDVNSERCLLLIMHDNTERLDLEAQLRQAQKMESIGQLAAGIAHDFNNILTIIQGHASRLHEVTAIPVPIRESVQQVSAAADRAANLTRQLLTFCRKQALVTKIIDLNQTVAHVSTMLERILGEDIALEVRGQENLPPINADSAMLELVLINLACNSRDAMPRGGTLRISTAAVSIDSAYVRHQPKARVGDYIRLTIRDTGCGMNREILRRAFEPFFTTKDVGKGTGLGLATVYGIVDQHQGWIEVESEPGKGTTFQVYLPETDKPCPRAAEPVAAAPVRSDESVAATRGGNETILLVEDEPALRELARMVLEDYKYRILEAASGVQALKVWQENKESIDMLLTDMVMPEGMTGRDLAERLQKEKPELRVLYSSGYSPDVVGGHFKLPENSFFLPKPYQPPTLAQAVRECLDNVVRRASQKVCEAA